MKKWLSPLLRYLLISIPIVAILAFSTRSFTTFSILKNTLVWCLLLLSIIVWHPQKSASPIFVGFSLLFLGWNAFSLLWTPNIGQGLLYLSTYSLGIIWIFIIQDVEKTYRSHKQKISPKKNLADIQLLAIFWLIAANIASLLAIYQRFWSLRLGLHQITSTIGNPNRLAGLLLIFMPLGWWLFVASSQKKARIFGASSIFVLFSGIMASRCHSALIASFVLFILWLIYYAQKNQHLKKHILPLIIAIISTFTTLILSSSTILRVLWKSLEGRFFIHHLSWQLWKEDLWLGVGLGGYPSKISWIQAKALQVSSHSWTNLRDPHNQFFQIATETGLIGIILFILIMAWFIKDIWKNKDRPHGFATLSALSVFFLYSMSETSMLSISSMLILSFWLVFGRLDEPSDVQFFLSPQKTNSRWYILFLLVGMWGFLQSTQNLYSDWMLGQGIKLSEKNFSLQKELNSYNNAVFYASEPSKALFYRGLFWQKLQKWLLAQKDFRRSFEQLPTPDRALAIGNSLFRQHKLKQAIYWGQKAIFLHPQYARAYANTGFFYIQLKRYHFAWRYLRRARSLRPFDKRIIKLWKQLPLKWQKITK